MDDGTALAAPKTFPEAKIEPDTTRPPTGSRRGPIS
ncbi:hypothetical protein QF030_001085 [Streptomyces rishiriensis]|uniref:Uncharacterized protein n=1 Tax=Streptomyces rishiriensis TaxID=68264 RepID=A0ABU0NJX8_STRRH|nr:hypothetical protein [Streptomyces rishiriensis]